MLGMGEDLQTGGTWQAGQVHPGRREDGKLWEGREGGGGGDGEVVGAGREEGLEAFVALPPSLPPVRLDGGLQLRGLAEVLLCALVRVEVARVL